MVTILVWPGMQQRDVIESTWPALLSPDKMFLLRIFSVYDHLTACIQNNIGKIVPEKRLEFLSAFSLTTYLPVRAQNSVLLRPRISSNCSVTVLWGWMESVCLKHQKGSPPQHRTQELKQDDMTVVCLVEQWTVYMPKDSGKLFIGLSTLTLSWSYFLSQEHKFLPYFLLQYVEN